MPDKKPCAVSIRLKKEKKRKEEELILDSHFPTPPFPNFPRAGELQFKEALLLIHLSMGNKGIIWG